MPRAWGSSPSPPWRRGCSPTATWTASPATRGPPGAGSLSRETLSDEVLSRIRGLNEIARERGQSLAQMALAWVLRDPRVTSTLIGVSSLRQLDTNLGALDNLTFTDDELAAIDQYAAAPGTEL